MKRNVISKYAVNSFYTGNIKKIKKAKQRRALFGIEKDLKIIDCVIDNKKNFKKSA